MDLGGTGVLDYNLSTWRMSHYVYIAKHRRRFACEGKRRVVFKIGYTGNKDSRQSSAKTWAPFGIQFRYFEFIDETQARAFEKIAHRQFFEYGIHDPQSGTEWFDCPKGIFQKVINSLEEGGTPRYSVWYMIYRLIKKRWINSWLRKMFM